jgi:ribosomal protein L11 methyltransferase
MDNDPDALQNARENIGRNGARADIEVIDADVRDSCTAPADIVTANLTAAVLLHHTSPLRRLVAPGGTLIVSGFSPEELPGVVAAFGGREVERVVEDEWAAAMISA